MPSETNDGNPFLVPTILVALLNGLFSPALFWVVIVAPVWFPSLLLPMTQGIVLYLSSLLVSTATLIVSMVPAALYERLLGGSDRVSQAIWFAGACVLTLPAFLRILGG